MNRGKRCIGIDVSTADGREVLLDLVRRGRRVHHQPASRCAAPLRSRPRRAARGERATSCTGGRAATATEDPNGNRAASTTPTSGRAPASATPRAWWSDEFVPQAGPALGDLTAGAFLAGGIAAALFRRERTGQGAIVDVSLLSSGMWAFAPGAWRASCTTSTRSRAMRHGDLPNALVAAYRTKDDRLDLSRRRADRRPLRELLRSDRPARPARDNRFATAADRAANVPRVHRDPRRRSSPVVTLAEWIPMLDRLSTPWTVVQNAWRPPPIRRSWRTTRDRRRRSRRELPRLCAAPPSSTASCRRCARRPTTASTPKRAARAGPRLGRDRVLKQSGAVL